MTLFVDKKIIKLCLCNSAYAVCVNCVYLPLLLKLVKQWNNNLFLCCVIDISHKLKIIEKKGVFPHSQICRKQMQLSWQLSWQLSCHYLLSIVTIRKLLLPISLTN